MQRRAWLMFSLIATACRRPRAADELLPQTLAGGWKRGDIRELALESMPVQANRNSVRRALTTLYRGPDDVQVDLLELTSEAAGLDLAQRWRPTADTVFFYQGSYFAVVKWQSFDRGHLASFVRTLQKHLEALTSGPRHPG